MDKTDNNFEQTLTQLETMVERLEQGQLPLQQSIDLFRDGVQAARQCHDYLSEAQLIVEQLNIEHSTNEPPTEKA